MNEVKATLKRPNPALAWAQKWLPRLMLALALTWFALESYQSVRLFAEHAAKAVVFRYSFDYGEGPLLDQVRRLAHFQNIYRADTSTPPYTITNYPPVYPLVQVPFYWIFGPQFWYGRIISLLGVLAAAVFIGLTLYHVTKSPFGAAIGGLTLLSIPYILHWSPLVRVDSLALGLSWAGLYVIVRWEHRRWGLLAGAALMVAAVYTRQSDGLAAPLAAFAWLVHKQPRIRAARWLAWMALLGGVPFLLLTLLTGGGFFFHIITANVNPFDWQTVQNYQHELQQHLPYLLIGGGVLILTIFWGKPKSWWLAVPYLLGSLATAATIGKDGSNVNYLYELSAALSLAAGALVAWPGKRLWLSAVLIMLLVPQIHSMTSWARQDFYPRNMDKLRYISDLKVMEMMVEDAQGPVLADEYMGHLPLAGKPIVYQPFEFKILAQGGLWNQQPFLDAIDGKQYSLILLYEPRDWDSPHARWTPEMLDAIQNSYKRLYRMGETSVYEPKP